MCFSAVFFNCRWNAAWGRRFVFFNSLTQLSTSLSNISCRALLATKFVNIAWAFVNGNGVLGSGVARAFVGDLPARSSLSPRRCVYALTWNYLALGLALRARGSRLRRSLPWLVKKKSEASLTKTSPEGQNEEDNKLCLRKNWSQFEEKMRKVELLPTRDCEAGYGPVPWGQQEDTLNL